MAWLVGWWRNSGCTERAAMVEACVSFEPELSNGVLDTAAIPSDLYGDDTAKTLLKYAPQI